MLTMTLAIANDATTQSIQPSISSNLMNLLPMVAIFVIFYFLLIRPQIKKQKELQNMVNNLKKGDKVIAAGGIIGKIVKIEDHFIQLDLGNENKIQIVKSSISDCINDKVEMRDSKK